MNDIEARLQATIIKWLKCKGCVVMKMPAGYASIPTGFPDILVLIDGGGWIALEIKASAKAKFQPLQKQWLEKLNGMFYARVVYKDNWEEIKKELENLI